MENEQQPQRQPTDFSDLSLTQMKFDDNFSVFRGSASQLIRGFQEMANRTGDGENDYQKSLYPALRELVGKLVSRYEADFLAGTVNEEKELVGTSLNGPYNNGTLRRFIRVPGVNPRTTYKFAQFGQLRRVLEHRLNYICKTDLTGLPEVVKEPLGRLIEKINSYLEYLQNDVQAAWELAVNNARATSGCTTGEVQQQSSPKVYYSRRVNNNAPRYTDPPRRYEVRRELVRPPRYENVYRGDVNYREQRGRYYNEPRRPMQRDYNESRFVRVPHSHPQAHPQPHPQAHQQRWNNERQQPRRPVYRAFYVPYSQQSVEEHQ
jgi:hypothetical protein